MLPELVRGQPYEHTVRNENVCTGLSDLTPAGTLMSSKHMAALHGPGGCTTAALHPHGQLLEH